MQELQIFKNENFGEIRTVEEKGKTYFVASDIANALGYQNITSAIKQHCRWVAKHDIPHPQSPAKALEVNVIPEGDIYRMVANSTLPKAMEFESWIFDEILPSIRKTGSYKATTTNNNLKEKEVEAKLNNSRVRMAQTWLKIAALTGIKEYKEIASTYAANTLANKDILQLPKSERKTYSATDIGQMFGVSSSRIGKTANANNLKTPEYGQMFYDKSRHSCKEVETFRYYDSVIPVFEKLLNMGVVA